MLLLLFVNSESLAQGVERGTESRYPPGWSIDAGVGSIALPKFPGARDLRYLPFPDVEVHYGELFFASLQDGIGVNLLRWNGFKLGPVANVAFPRSDSLDERALHGLSNVKTTIETGGFIAWECPPYVSTKLEIRKGVNGHEGIVADWELTSGPPPFLDNKLVVLAGPHVTYYNRAYSKAYFGVTQAESLASGYAAFDPNYSAKVGGSGILVYLWNDKVSSVLFVDYGRLYGDAGNSPIVRGRYGSVGQAFAALTVTYRFAL